MVLWTGREGRAEFNIHTKNVRSVWFVVKRRGCCCILSGGVALIVQFTTNGMCVKNNIIIYVARASNSKRDCGAWSLLLLAATVRNFARMPLGISDRNQMVLWPGLGRREVRLHTSEEATACSSLNCASRCILFTVPCACILFVLWRAADLLICDLLACCWIHVHVDGLRISHYCSKMPLTYHACNSQENFLPYFTIVCWRHGSCWNSFRAACSPIARPRVSSPWVTQLFFCVSLQRLSRPAWRLTRRSK